MQTALRDAAPDPKNIEPFWNRLREISLYPAQTGALTTIAVLALCRLVTYLPFGWFLDLFVWVALYKYAIECLRATANGKMRAPEYSATVDDSFGWTMIKLQVIFLVINIAVFLLFGVVAGLLTSVVLAFALPGAMMSVAMDGNLGLALNPATWFAIMQRLGGAYFFAALLCFVFWMSQANASAILLPFLPGVLAVIVYYVLAHYVVVATFHLMGYLIWQYHDILNYEPKIELPLVARGNADAQLLNEVQQLVRDGDAERAIDLLSVQLRERGGTPELHQRYRKLLSSTGRKDELLRHGQEWMHILLAQENYKRALELTRECVALDPAFRPPADAINLLATRAADSGQSQLALSLLSGFHKLYPKHADLPANLFLAARLLADRMGKNVESRRMLDFLIAQYPQHQLADEFRAYRKYLDTFPGATGKA
jgi:tetratricopeptide (TPR) repeat protein